MCSTVRGHVCLQVHIVCECLWMTSVSVCVCLHVYVYMCEFVPVCGRGGGVDDPRELPLDVGIRRGEGERGPHSV